jgi:hypothetical protein
VEREDVESGVWCRRLLSLSLSLSLSLCSSPLL